MVGRIEEFQGELYPGEAPFAVGMPGSRAAEFRAGRTAARMALERLGVDGCAIPVGEGGEPIWPPGVVGSISHSCGLCACAVAPSDLYLCLGVDVEGGSRISRRLARRFLGEEGYPHLPVALFSLRESFIKAFHRLRGEIPSLRGIDVRFGGGRLWVEWGGIAMPGAVLWWGDLVLTIVALESDSFSRVS